MQKQKIIHMVEDLKVGGLEKVVATIVLGLNKGKYEVEIWCLAAGGLIADELRQKGIKVRVLGMTSYYNPIAVYQLWYLMRKERVNVLHTHGYFPSIFGRMSGLLAAIPRIITHVHTMKKRKAFIEKTFSLFTDKIVCVSRAVQEFVVSEEGVRRGKTVLIYNGIEDPERKVFSEEELRQKEILGFGKEDIVLIVVASLTKHKGHRVLIDSFAREVTKNSNLKLLIVGVGPLKAEIEEYVRELNLASNVRFTGLRRDILLLLSMADIFVLPSIEKEGLGLAIIEAIAMNKPVIGSKLGGIPEIIEDEVNGFLVPPGDADKLGHAIEILARDKHLRVQMGEMGRRIFEKNFRRERMINAIEAIYDEEQ